MQVTGTEPVGVVNMFDVMSVLGTVAGLDEVSGLGGKIVPDGVGVDVVLGVAIGTKPLDELIVVLRADDGEATDVEVTASTPVELDIMEVLEIGSPRKRCC